MSRAPEASLVLTLCNQAGTAEAAIRSAFAQGGIVLEIIVSDDASDDATAEIAKRLVSAYEGPHRVRFRANAKRMWRDHFPLLAETAAGAFVILAHGDDFMFPNRCARLLDEHRRTGARLVTSQVRRIHAQGRDAGIWGPPSIPDPALTSLVAGLKDGLEKMDGVVNPGFIGAAMGWHKDLFQSFPPLDRRYSPIGFDYLLTFRAAMLGPVAIVAEPLLDYSVGMNFTAPEHEVTLPGEIENRLFCDLGFLSALLRDMEHAAAAGREVPDALRETVRRLCLERLYKFVGNRGSLAQSYHPTWLPNHLHRDLIERQWWHQARWFLHWAWLAVKFRLGRLR